MAVKKKITEEALAKKVASKPVEKKVETKHTKPLGIKIISTYYIIVSILAFLFGVLIIIFPKKANDYLLKSTATVGPQVFAFYTPTFFLIIGILAIIWGAFIFYLGLSLFKLKNWARYVIMILACLAFFGAIIGLLFTGDLSNIAGIVIYGFIAGYLIFSKEAKAAF